MGAGGRFACGLSPARLPARRSPSRPSCLPPVATGATPSPDPYGPDKAATHASQSTGGSSAGRRSSASARPDPAPTATGNSSSAPDVAPPAPPPPASSSPAPAPVSSTPATPRPTTTAKPSQRPRRTTPPCSLRARGARDRRGARATPGQAARAAGGRRGGRRAPSANASTNDQALVLAALALLALALAKREPAAPSDPHAGAPVESMSARASVDRAHC